MQESPKTPRGEDYRKRLHLTDRRKRVNARDIDGEPLLFSPKPKQEYGSELHEFMRTMQRELGSQEEFVGIQLAGSTTRGHGRETSDIDTTVFFDSSTNPKANEKIARIFDSTARDLHRRGLLTHKIQPSLFDLNLDNLRHHLGRNFDDEEDAGVLYAVILGLCGLTIGPRVDEYRKEVGKIISDLPRGRAEELLSNLVRFALLMEKNSKGKREERITRLDQRNETKADRARLALWAKQVGRSLGIHMGVEIT